MRRLWWLFLVLSLVGIIARLILSYYYPGNFDLESYRVVVDILRHYGNVYTETARYNYSPIWSWMLLSFDAIARSFGISFEFVIHSFLTLVDIGIAILLIRISGKYWVGALYLINPITILLTGVHGQFDNLAALPLLGAVLLNSRKPGNGWAIWLLGTISILIKQITVFAVLALFIHCFKLRKSILLFILSGLIFLASFISYLPDGQEGIVSHVLLYSSVIRPYGLPDILPAWPTALFALMMLIVTFASRSIPLLESLVLSFVSFLVFAPGMSEQYFILPIIFASAIPGWGYAIFTCVTTVFLMGSQNNLHLPVPSIWMSVWIAASTWLLFFLIKLANRRNYIHSLDTDNLKS